MKYNKGFTLVELLIVVSVIGILAGVTISVINPERQKAIAEDGARKSNLEKVATGIEMFFQLENYYPDQGDSNNPLLGADASLLGNYISVWPENFVYIKDNDSFAVYVVTATNSDNIFKYSTSWRKIRECPNGLGAVTTCE